ncbi:MAG: flagellar motor protein MotB [Spirochaetales bacterium]|nr:flagellar motor protein MotB [Spirochaetales bacterium]
MAEFKKKKKCPEGAPDWMLTYGDMVTLLLTFFVMMYTTAEVDGSELKLILAAFSGLGIYEGGNTLEAGRLAELGNNVMTLPSLEKGRALDKARKSAISQFQPEIKSNKVRITEDERGLIISLAADSFFRQASAEVDIENTRELLFKLAGLLTGLSDRKFRIEGHTDSMPTDPDGPWPTNWELSADRAINTLKYLTELGVPENRFQVSGMSDTVPLASNDTPEGRAYNRRIDIVILSEGHL